MQKAWLPVLVLGVVFFDVLTFNVLLNRLAYSRVGASDLYAAPIQSLETAVATAQTPVERLYGPPMTSVGYRNSPLQLRVEATWGYNPLALAAYADYQAAAEGNPRLIDGLAATHFVELRPDGAVALEPNPTVLPLAYFASAIRPLPDAGAVAEAIASLDPALETLVVEPAPEVEVGPQRRRHGRRSRRAAPHHPLSQRQPEPAAGRHPEVSWLARLAQRPGAAVADGGSCPDSASSCPLARARSRCGTRHAGSGSAPPSAAWRCWG